MYHDYYDAADAGGLRNPYGPEVRLLPAERGSHRQRLLLLGMVGAGLSVVAPEAGGGIRSGADRVTVAADTHHAGPAADDTPAARAADRP